MGFDLDAQRQAGLLSRRARALARHSVGRHAIALHALPVFAVVLVVPKLPIIAPPPPEEAVQIALSDLQQLPMRARRPSEPVALEVLPACDATGPCFLNVFTGAMWNLPLVAAVRTRLQPWQPSGATEPIPRASASAPEQAAERTYSSSTSSSPPAERGRSSTVESVEGAPTLEESNGKASASGQPVAI